MKFKKRYLIFIIVALIGLIIGGVKLYQYLRIKNAKIIVELKSDLTAEFLTEKKLSDFLESINGTLLEDYEIDTTKIGKQNLKVKYVNDDNIKVSYNFDIEVVDTVAPLVWLGNSYTIYKGNSFNYQKILCGDNEDDNPNCYIEGEYDKDTVGVYPLVFKAIDRSNNETSLNFNLKVVEPPKSGGSSSGQPSVTHFTDVYQEFKTPKTKIGLDVSRWQGDIDFAKIKEAGVEFIIIKIGGTLGTDEDYYLDAKFIQNIKKANEYDIDVGLYFYSYANNEESAKKDALWLVDQIKDYKITLPIAFDWEDWNNFNDYHLSFYRLNNMANAFLKTIEEHGYQGMLYSSKTYLEKLWLPTEYDVWLAHYTNKTNYQGKYRFWQLCDDGQIDGINGAVDIDIMYTD